MPIAHGHIDVLIPQITVACRLPAGAVSALLPSIGGNEVASLSLLGRTAYITGGARGLGFRTAQSLAEMGCDVAIGYLHSAVEAEALAQAIRGTGRKAIAVQGDVALRGDMERAMTLIESTLGGVDIVVNCAGPFVRERRLFADYDADEIDYLLQANLLGAMQLDRLVLQGMRRRGWGRIVHFGFGHAAESRGWPHRAVYAAAKVGLVSFTKTLAEEEAANGITVNMICPGDIRGEYKEKGIADAIPEPEGETPRGRPGTGEDVARVVAFLCQPESDFITGNMIDVTGAFDPIRSMAEWRSRNQSRNN